MFARQVSLIRKFSTSINLARPALSTDYKSTIIWDTRFSCPLLDDNAKIKAINSKILMGDELKNVELDIFINIAGPRTDEIVHLQEAAKLLKAFRKSLNAHTLLASTHHAACRLFLESKRLPSLMNVLDRRVDYGLFPDAYSINLIFDDALEQGKLSLASRAAALIMLQEEFGLNKLSDRFALYSTAKYIESRTDFSDWNPLAYEKDPITNSSAVLEQEDDSGTGEVQSEEAKKKEKSQEEEEEEEEEEYYRIPFLRNKYFDDHFDLTNPRVICGKTLGMLGMQMSKENSQEIANKCHLLASILRGHWEEARSVLDKSVQSRQPIDVTIKETCQHYINELNGIDGPEEKVKEGLLSSLDKLSCSGATLSELAESDFANIKQDLEHKDINWLKENLKRWSEQRVGYMNAIIEVENRKKLIEEIKAKKAELIEREQFLYFYDNLKKRSLTRIDYK